MSALGVIGAGGRFGSAIVAAAAASGWTVTLRATSGGWVESSAPDVVVDVSRPDAVERTVAYCLANELGLLYGVSGLGAEGHELLREATATVPVLVASNFSAGHRLQRRALSALLLAASPQAGGDWRAAVRERHPASKRDAPSATALELRDLLDGAGLPVGGVDCEREGPPVSDHEVILTRDGEEVRLLHRVGDLVAAAGGALRAAEWMLAAPAGLWSLGDVESVSWGAIGAESEHEASEQGGGNGRAGN